MGTNQFWIEKDKYHHNNKQNPYISRNREFHNKQSDGSQVIKKVIAFEGKGNLCFCFPKAFLSCKGKYFLSAFWNLFMIQYLRLSLLSLHHFLLTEEMWNEAHENFYLWIKCWRFKMIEKHGFRESGVSTSAFKRPN